MATLTFRVIPMGVRRGLWRYSEWQLLVALFLVGDVKNMDGENVEGAAC
jgi:hypothetical protein